MHVLLTGGAGFIASHIVEHIRSTRSDWRISIIDRLNYAGSLDRLARYRADDKVDRKSTRLNSSHQIISYAVFCLKKKTRTSPHPHGPSAVAAPRNRDVRPHR